MNDDIVTRLREIADADMYRADISVSKLYEAAEEIERLRVWLAELGERHSAQEAKHHRIIRELEAQLKAARGE